MSDDTVQVKYIADIQNLLSGVNRATESLEGMHGTVGNLTSTFAKFGEALAAAFAVEKVAEFAEHFSDLGEKAENASKQLGIATEKLQLFQAAQVFSGGSAEGAVTSFTRLERNMEEAAKKSGDARNAFALVGVTLTNLKSGNTDLILNKIAAAYGNTADGADKAANAIALMGRGGATMIPMFDRGTQGLAAFKQKMEETGEIMATDMVERFAEAHQSFEFLEAATTGLGQTMYDALRPAIDEVVSGLTDLIEGINNSVKAGGEWYQVITAIIAILDAFVIGIDAVVLAIRVLYDETLLAIAEMEIAWQTLGKVMMDVLSGNWSRIETDYKAGMAQIKAETEKTTKEIEDHWDKFKERAGKTAGDVARRIDGGGTEKPESAPKKKLGSTVDSTAAEKSKQEAIKIATDNIATKQKLDQTELAMEKDKLDTMVQLGLISEQRAIEIKQQFEQRSYNIDLRAIQSETQVSNLTLVQKQKLFNQIQVLKAQHEQRMQQLNLQSTMQQAKQYQQVFQAINTSFRGSLQGVLQGTQTIGQAMSSMATNVIASLAEMFAEQALQWAESKILGLTTAGIEGAGIIEAHAAEAGAAAYASTAAIPVVGPALAPAAALKASAEASAFSAALPSFDVGSWNIPTDMIAKVHKGEIIVPAAQAAAIRSIGPNGTGTGGNNQGQGDTHIHIHATDAQSVKRLIMANSAAVVAAAKSESRKFSNNTRP